MSDSNNQIIQQSINQSINLSNKKVLEHVKHTFEPIYDMDSEILILGSFPSVKSRENGFYYGHPQNRFWKVLSYVFQSAIPCTIEEKRNFLLSQHLALWDVIESCEIIGSDDNSIQKVVPNNMNVILKNANIKGIYANGKMAGKLYEKYIEPDTNKKIITLPSTSPANATFSLTKLIENWERLKLSK